MIYVRGSRSDYDEWKPARLELRRAAAVLQAVGGQRAGRLRVPTASADRWRCPTGAPGSPARRPSSRPRSRRPPVQRRLQRGRPGRLRQLAADPARAGGAASAATGLSCARRRARANLTVETHLQVHRVRIEDGRAVSVVGRQPRRRDRDHGRGGRSSWPPGRTTARMLLMLSGIGPADKLRSSSGPAGSCFDPAAGSAAIPPSDQLAPRHCLRSATSPLPSRSSLLIAREPQYVRQIRGAPPSGPMTSNGPETGGFVRSDGG